MIFIKRFFLFFLTCMLIMCGIFIFLFGTNFGINLIFMGITHRIPGLTIESVSGRWGHMNIINLAYQIPQGIIKIDDICLSINLKYILLKQVNIQHIFLKNVFIKANKIKSIQNNIKNNQKIKINYFFSNIFSIILQDLILYNTYIISDDCEFQCKKLNTSLMFRDNLLTILFAYITEGSILNKFSIDLLQYKLDTNTIQAMCFMNNQLNLKYQFKNLINTFLKKISRPKYNIPINFILKDIQGKNFYLYNYCRSNYYLIDYFQMQMIKNTDMVNIEFNVNFPSGYVKAVGDIILNNYFPINLTVDYVINNNIKNHNYYGSKQNFKNINLIITGDLIHELCVRFDFFHVVSIIHILFKIKLKPDGIPIDLLVIGKKVPFFLLKKKSYLLDNINLHIFGELRNNFYIEMQSDLICDDTFKIHVSLYAQGNIRNCTISQLKVNFLNEYYCNVNGGVSWDKLINWSNMYVFNNIKFSKKYFKSISINLCGKISMQGYVSEDSWELKISKFQFSGNINDNPVICQGSIYLNSYDTLNIPVFFIKWGTSILEIQGGFTKNYIFDFDIKFREINCSNFVSKLNGNLYGYCKLYGPIKSLVISSKIYVNSLIWKDHLISIKDILIDSSIHFNKFDQSFFLLKFDQIKYKNLLLYQLYIEGKGNIKEHNFNIKINSNELFGQMNLLGKFDSKCYIWNSRIIKTNFVTSMGTWKLMQDVILSYQHLSKKIVLTSHFWENTNFQFSVSNKFQKNIFKKINAICEKFHIITVDLIPIDTLNINNLNILFTDFYWIIGSNCLPQGTICFSGSQLFVKDINNQKKISSIIMNDITIKCRLNQVGLFVSWVINNTNNNKNFGNFYVTDVYDVPKIIGTVCIQDISLLPIFKLLLPSKIVSNECLNININFKGHAHNIKVYGVIKYIYDDVIKCNKLFFIKNSLLQINFFGDSAKFFGITETDCGKRLYLNGNMRNFNSINSINIVINLTGNLINTYILPDVYVTISPNIICIITGNKIDIRGDIYIPAAQIKIKEFSKHITDISSEEIILDHNLNPVSKISKDYPIVLSSNIIIHLGNDVDFHGFGLHTKLKGNLEIVYNNNELTAIGHINMCSGYFEAYGQNLTIKKGQLLFSGLVNQVYFDIEVMRNTMIPSHIKDSITAGVRITGMIDQLKLDFFSNSILLSQQEIMSYLLGGYNLVLSDISTIYDTNIITSLLIGVSMKRYEKIINRIGYFLGIKDLKINTQGLGTPSLIAVSGYIAPGLQIKYGTSIFDFLTTVTMRYYIHPYLYLEATSGGRRLGLDLLYHLHS